jgi:hypothetical protein
LRVRWGKKNVLSPPPIHDEEVKLREYMAHALRIAFPQLV